jgi:hypothetical protein
VAAVAFAVLAAVLSLRSDGGSDGTAGGAGANDSDAAAAEEVVDARSDAPRFTTVAELTAAADLVVVGEVTASERGRWFGDGGDGARIQSRLATLRVDEVVRGPDAVDGTDLLVEEEGWLEDGRALAIDGAPPTRVGDAGVWFLIDPGDATTDAWIVVSAQGRYVASGDALDGALGGDPLITSIEEGGLSALLRQVRMSG